VVRVRIVTSGVGFPSSSRDRFAIVQSGGRRRAVDDCHLGAIAGNLAAAGRDCVPGRYRAQHELKGDEMKVKVPLAMLLLALTVGYVLGTENGRAQRDMILVKLGRKEADEPASDDAASGEAATA
jgi:hypothetical protein